MWPKEYKDYPKDSPLKKERVSTGKGIIGCEMHEHNGWGETSHRPKPRKRGLVYSLLNALFGSQS
ncbi:MAG: hypothetical protein VX777_02390 [Chlamydiota bacterium]|nr:hypothetical protein [Chlamydiota bacterium]